MLVLSRKQGQKISIGGGITISILGIRGNALKLGIEAPAGVRILRSEIQPFDAVVLAADQIQAPLFEGTTVSGSI